MVCLLTGSAMAYLLLLYNDETHKKFSANAFYLLLGKERILHDCKAKAQKNFAATGRF